MCIRDRRCTIAVRRYIENGGLYMVLYDTNSYAGPVASFLGCSPYQFAVRSSNIGFAGPGVIKSTTGMDVPPKYHRCYKALTRGHIQGIWDRRQIRNNLKQALQTIGGRNLYSVSYTHLRVSFAEQPWVMIAASKINVMFSGHFTALCQPEPLSFSEVYGKKTHFSTSRGCLRGI